MVLLGVREITLEELVDVASGAEVVLEKTGDPREREVPVPGGTETKTGPCAAPADAASKMSTFFSRAVICVRLASLLQAEASSGSWSVAHYLAELLNAKITPWLALDSALTQLADYCLASCGDLACSGASRPTSTMAAELEAVGLTPPLARWDKAARRAFTRGAGPAAALVATCVHASSFLLDAADLVAALSCQVVQASAVFRSLPHYHGPARDNLVLAQRMVRAETGRWGALHPQPVVAPAVNMTSALAVVASGSAKRAEEMLLPRWLVGAESKDSGGGGGADLQRQQLAAIQLKLRELRLEVSEAVYKSSSVTSGAEHAAKAFLCAVDTLRQALAFEAAVSLRALDLLEDRALEASRKKLGDKARSQKAAEEKLQHRSELRNPTPKGLQLGTGAAKFRDYLVARGGISSLGDTLDAFGADRSARSALAEMLAARAQTVRCPAARRTCFTSSAVPRRQDPQGYVRHPARTSCDQGQDLWHHSERTHKKNKKHLLDAHFNLSHGARFSSDTAPLPLIRQCSS